MDTFNANQNALKNPESIKTVARRWATAGTSGLLVAVAGYATLTSAAVTPRVAASIQPRTIAAAVGPVVRDLASGAIVDATEKSLVSDTANFTTFSSDALSFVDSSGTRNNLCSLEVTPAVTTTAFTATGASDTSEAFATPTTQPSTAFGFSTQVIPAAGETAVTETVATATTATETAIGDAFDDDEQTAFHDFKSAGVTWQPATQPTKDAVKVAAKDSTNEPAKDAATTDDAFVASSASANMNPTGASDANPNEPPTHLYPPTHEMAEPMKAPPEHPKPPASNARPEVDAPVATTPTPAPVASTIEMPAKTTGMITSGLGENGKVALTLNRTVELKTNVRVKRVSIGQPEIADVQPFSTNMILVTAKKPGTTQVIVWDDKDHSQSVDVSVEIPLDQLKDLISKVAPTAKIEVSVANDQIVLRGQAPNLTVAKQVTDLAGAYGKVQNFVEVAGAQTVAVQVQFAEVSRSVTNDLGVSWAYQNGTSIFGSDPVGSGLLGFHANDDGAIDGIGPALRPGQFNIFGLGTASGNPFAYFIKALRDNNLLRILQEPTLTTTSGEAASFLAGGQVPVPVPADNGQVAIEYKEFGVRLKLTPVVLGNGKIRLVMEAESSDLDYANGTTISGAAVPGLRTRRVQNTVELGEGQTISVAGLLSDSVTASKRSVPLLGDIPILGQLFRSTRYQRQETELVILITPRLAGAMNPDQITPLPGAAWRHPNELEQFAFGDLGGNAEADAVKDWNKPASERGLKGLETQKNTTRAQEPAALTRATTPPPTFVGDQGFAPPEQESTSVTTIRDPQD